MSAPSARVWWSMMCDASHRWEAESPDVPEPPPEVWRCPVCGMEAVTAQRQPPADYVRICLVSAARVGDAVRGDVIKEGQWYLEIVRSDGGDTMRSHQPWPWNEAIERAARFQELTWPEAENRWRRTMK